MRGGKNASLFIAVRFPVGGLENRAVSIVDDYTAVRLVAARFGGE